MKAVYIGADNARHPKVRRLTISSEYVILGIFGGGNQGIKFRILGDDGTPILLLADDFKIISSSIPSEWTFSLRLGGEWDLEPEAWSEKGFWIAYFDGDPSAEAAFDRVAIALGAPASVIQQRRRPS